MGSQTDGLGGGGISFRSCGKRSWECGDRILKRYPGPSKSQSRLFTITEVQYFDVPAMQTLPSCRVEMSHHN